MTFPRASPMLWIVLIWLAASVIGLFQAAAGVDLPLALQPPSLDAWLGRDPLGKSVATMLTQGATTAALIGLTSVGIAGIAGTLLGAVAGVLGGRTDAVLMRIIDVLLAFPGILLAIAITAVLGPSTLNIIFALSILGWTGFARLARGQTLQIKAEPFVDAAFCQGAGIWRIIRWHVLPNLLGPVMVQATFGMAGAIIAESSLSFLGLGDPTQASWGAMLADGVRFLRDAPHLSIFPGLAISIVVLSLNSLGDNLADRFDPKRQHPV